MGWPYEFVNLDAAQTEARRESLDYYGSLAHASAALPVLVAAVYRAVLWATSPGGPGWRRGSSSSSSSLGEYAAVPGSPSRKHQSASTVGGVKMMLRKAQWWLGDEFVLAGRGWGQRDQVLFGLAWTVWLGILCFAGTGKDYMHVTKRLGIVAVAQFPLQYALSLKQLNPVAWAFGSSHEQVNRIHRPLGRVVYLLLCLHAVLYLNFYYQIGVLQQKMTMVVPVLGMLSITGLTLLMTTSLQAVRQFSYRVFFVTHLFISLAVPVAIFFHAHSARVLVVECLVIFLADIGIRRMGTIEVDTRLSRMGDSGLIKMDVDIPPQHFPRFGYSPGSHIYMNVPHASRPSRNPLSPSNAAFELIFSPFSIADANDKTHQITLVARHHRGPMTNNLDRLAGVLEAADNDHSHGDENDDDDEQPSAVLAIQGPFGCARRFPNLAGPEFSSVLLVAGGVGATFIVPIYRAIVAERSFSSSCSSSSTTTTPTTDTFGGGAAAAAGGGEAPAVTPRVRLIWAMRAAVEATWAMTTDNNTNTGNGGAGNDLMSDDNCELFLTGSILSSSSSRGATAGGGGEEGSSDIPMARLPSSSSSGRAGASAATLKQQIQRNRRRPDLGKIVDDVFKKASPHGRVAVLVCGPKEMAKELRGHVGGWVEKGRDVFWHDEGFSW